MSPRYSHAVQRSRHRPVAVLRSKGKASKRVALLVCLPLIWFTAAFAQEAVSRDAVPEAVMPEQEPPVLDGLVDAISNGDARALIKHSSNRVDVTIFGMSELFSRSQAGFVFRDFFDEYRPERFVVTETSGSMGNWFAAGRYWYTRGEAPLAVYFRLRFGEGEWELKEVRIGRTIDK